ncbi:membrane protein [Terrihabitans soli]|uniref:Membrane protein n=1 Tax=Terrihabitans soli TaxID=708113 RepID=A0A6S6QRT0_9HYPH|nr:M23 family metallopeptidase [Terrihabitans soli]BCJ89741.1 membrane protein [Terrihabitans soli]
MNTRAHKDGFHRARAIEIGDEPPLRLDGDEPGSSRSVNIRWFASTCLAGVLGIGLLGTAIITSMDGSYNLATPGVFARWDPYGSRPARGTNANRKGDQIAQTRSSDDTRQIFRVSTTTKTGNREVVRTRPVTRIAAGLIAANLDVDIPAFNPLAMVADNDDAAADSAGSGGEALPSTDGEIAFTVKNLADLKLGVDDGLSISLEDVLAAVRDTAAIESMNTADFQQFGGGDPSGTDTASLGGMSMPMPGSNMTVIAKTVSRNNAAGADDNERIVTARPNDRLDALLMRQGATQQEAREIAAAFGSQSGYGTMGLLAGQQVKILMAPAGPRLQPVRVIVASGSSESIVALSDTGGYVAVADAPEIAQEGEEVATAPTGRDGDLSLYQSFYGTALAKGVPKPVIDELVKVFGYDADFQRKVGGGDSFEVLFGSDDSGQVDGPPEVIYCSLTAGGESRRYYRYQSPEDGAVDYYDEEGRSARKFLMRKPVAQAVMRSGFGLRRHPILGYSKMHTGVDWAAPRGTPIYAAGSGVVELAERNSGYGNQVKIQHANGYETAYGHMQGFAKGMKEGLRVRQGQLIGYVGSTGLSTGPHVHYEVLVNGRFVNPMRIKVPRGREIEGAALAEFKRERERIDGLVGRDGSGQAQLTQTGRSGG